MLALGLFLHDTALCPQTFPKGKILNFSSIKIILNINYAKSFLYTLLYYTVVGGLD
jgi:hypothetical protein